MNTITLTSKGQITLPAAVRQTLGLRTSEKLELSVDTKQQVITIRKSIPLENLAKKYGKLVPKNVTLVKDVSAYYDAHRSEAVK